VTTAVGTLKESLLARMGTVVGAVRRTYPVRLAQAYGQSQSSYYAAALAFKAFVSMFPLILGLLAVVGLLLRSPEAQAQAQAMVLSFFPADARPALQHTMSSLHRASGILGIIAIVGMVWSGGSLFITLEFALGQVLGTGQRGFLRQRGMAFAMTVVFVLVILLTIGANAAAGLVKGLPFAGPVVGAAVWIAFTLVVYRYVPNRSFRLPQLWRGAVLAGVLMEVLTLLWPLYVRLSHGFNTYGSTFALFLLLAAWLYFWAQLTLLGAVVNRLHRRELEVGGVVHEPGRGTVETEASRAVEEKARR
jgi:membrane protein